MIQQYDEINGDGIDPGLGDLAYDGAEYELDEFGERIGGTSELEDFADDRPADIIDDNEIAQTDATKIEHGFGETINPDSNPHIDDQLQDESLSQEAETDYDTPGTNPSSGLEQGDRLHKP